MNSRPESGSYWDIQGGASLGGRIRIAGFKHLLVPCMAAACLADEPWEIENVPDITDLHVLAAMLRELGADVGVDLPSERARLNTAGLVRHDIDNRWSASAHGGTYLLPVLLARFGQVRSGPHGGCRITGSGARPMTHLAAVLQRFGARCEYSGGAFYASAPHGLRGTQIDLADFAEIEPTTATLTGPYYSGATKTALLAAATARGTTVLRNPYPKPDALGLAHILGQSGVPIDVDEHAIVIHGVDGPIGRARPRLLSDLVEVVTFVAAAVHLRCELELRLDQSEAVRAGLAPELARLAAMGIPLIWTDDGQLRVQPPERLTPTQVIAASHLVYSDAQPLFALMLLNATGSGMLIETVWDNRFGYVEGLRTMGADLCQQGRNLRVAPSILHPAREPLHAPDLRAAMTLLLAALGTRIPQRLYGVEHLARGYSGLASKLQAIGAHIDERWLPAVLSGKT